MKTLKPNLKFKQLKVGDRFEFKNTTLPGPWVKVSPRKYKRDTHSEWPEHTVGTVRVQVELLERQ